MSITNPSKPKRTVAAICFLLLFFALKFGGPLGFFKLMFCEYPFARITSIGDYPEPGDTELQVQMYEDSVRDAEGRVQMALLYTWLGGLLYLAAVVTCIIFIARKHEDRMYLCLMLAGAAVLLFFAISLREVQFGV